MLYPLFDKDCNLIAWLDSSKNIFDTDMQWIAYISSNHIWSSSSGNWLGPIEGTVCYDMEVGRVTHTVHLPVKFLQISFGGIAFFLRVWYSELEICRD